MGQTGALSLGRKGATMSVKNTLNEDADFWHTSLTNNIALQLEAKNGKENIALDILSGGIRMAGKIGYTGNFSFTLTDSSGWTTTRKTYTLEITNGIITNVIIK